MGGRHLAQTGWQGMPSLKRQNAPQLHRDPSLQATPASSPYLLSLVRDGVGIVYVRLHHHPIQGEVSSEEDLTLHEKENRAR